MQEFREKYAYRISLSSIIFAGVIIISIYFLKSIESIEIFKSILFFDFYIDVIFFFGISLSLILFILSLVLRFFSQDTQKKWLDIVSLLLGSSLVFLIKTTDLLFCRETFQGDMGMQICPDIIISAHKLYYSLSVLKILPAVGIITCFILSLKFFFEFKRRVI